MATLFNPRDITWLGFNERVLQEAMDPSVPILQRIKFLGIFSNNLDEFFRVRVAGLKKASKRKDELVDDSFFDDPEKILAKINKIVVSQQKKFDETWEIIQEEMALQNVFLRTSKNLNDKQKEFVKKYFHNEVESNVIPILLKKDSPMPYVREKSLYLGVAMRKIDWHENNYAIIEVPTEFNGRFVSLPSEKGKKEVILLEDIIAFNLPYIFSYFGYNKFKSSAFKITKDAEFNLNDDLKITYENRIADGIKSRRKGRPTRFIFDKSMDKTLLEILTRKLNLTKKDSIIPGQKIHNFKHFMDFPNVFKAYKTPLERTSFLHPDFVDVKRVTDIVIKKDVLLTFPYHSYTPVIDILRESAMDPDVKSIQITAYRLARNSKIINTLVNAVRNGKEVTVMVELRARFDEAYNLLWKDYLELEGVKVLVGIPNKKIHAKLCIIEKTLGNETLQYGFVSTGNFNEKTAQLYGDHLLMTADKNIMTDVGNLFNLFRKPKTDLFAALKNCQSLLVSPPYMREKIMELIDNEIQEAKNGKKAEIIIKANAVSDEKLIKKLYEAADAGVVIKMIVRGVFCPVNQKKFKEKIFAISIVDEYLEHARVMYFYNKGKEDVYISSADWMSRNLDFRVEAAIKINNPALKSEMKDLLEIQLNDNVKARLLDNKISNRYVRNEKENCRSQVEIYKYLKNKSV